MLVLLPESVSGSVSPVVPELPPLPLVPPVSATPYSAPPGRRNTQGLASTEIQ